VCVCVCVWRDYFVLKNVVVTKGRGVGGGCSVILNITTTLIPKYVAGYGSATTTFGHNAGVFSMW
jgi:hypothetical protein